VGHCLLTLLCLAALLTTAHATPSTSLVKRSKMASLPGVSDREKLDALCQQTHKEQAVWFLNAFWEVRSFTTAQSTLVVLSTIFSAA
jgi:hypothetical protein